MSWARKPIPPSPLPTTIPPQHFKLRTDTSLLDWRVFVFVLTMMRSQQLLHFLSCRDYALPYYAICFWRPCGWLNGSGVATAMARDTWLYFWSYSIVSASVCDYAKYAAASSLYLLEIGISQSRQVRHPRNCLAVGRIDEIIFLGQEEEEAIGARSASDPHAKFRL